MWDIFAFPSISSSNLDEAFTVTEDDSDSMSVDIEHTDDESDIEDFPTSTPTTPNRFPSFRIADPVGIGKSCIAEPMLPQCGNIFVDIEHTDDESETEDCSNTSTIDDVEDEQMSASNEPSFEPISFEYEFEYVD